MAPYDALVQAGTTSLDSTHHDPGGRGPDRDLPGHRGPPQDAPSPGAA